MEKLSRNLGEDETIGCQDFVMVFVLHSDATWLPARSPMGGELGVPRLIPAKMFQ